MSDLDLSIGFDLNNQEVDAELDQTRERIRGVGNEASRQEGILQRLERQARIYARGMREATIPENIERYNRHLQTTQAEITRLTTLTNNAGQSGRSSFNGLQNSINQISRELPAFTFSAQTGFLAISNNLPILADELARVRAANAALVASGQTATPVWKQLIGSLFSWGTALSLGVTLLTIYGKEIGNFIGSLFKGKEAINLAKESIKDLNKALDSTDYKKAVINIAELTASIDLAKKGFIDKKDVVEEYNKTIGKTTGQVSTLEAAEKALAKNADAYIKMTLYKAAANLALEEAAKSAVEAEKQRLKNLEDFRNGISETRVSSGGFGGGTGAFNANEYEATTKRINAARDKRKNDAIKIETDAQDAQTKIANTFIEKAGKISSENKFDFFGKADVKAKAAEDAAKKAESEFAKIIESRKGMFDKIQALDDEYRAKGFASDKEELEALANKFKKFRKTVEDENAKIAEYNVKHKKQASLLDISQVDKIEQRATSDLRYKQDTAKQALEYERQKKLYEDYENYKNTFGEAKAKERYGKEVKSNADLIRELEAQTNALAAKAALGAISGSVGLTGGESSRLEQKGKELTELKAIEAKRYADAYSSALSSAQKIEKINEEYRNKAKALGKNITDDQKNELLRKRDEEVNAEKETALRKIEIYEDLNRQLITLTREQIKEQLKSIGSILADPNVSDKIKEGLKKLQNDLKGNLNLSQNSRSLNTLNLQKSDVEKKIINREKSGIVSPENDAQLKKLYADLLKIEAQINKIEKKGLGGFLDKLKDNKAIAGVATGLGLASDAALTMSQALGGVDTEAGYTLDTIGQLAGAAADLGASIVSGDPAKIIGSAIKAVGSLFSIGKKVKEMNAAARKEVADFYSNAIAGEREYQDLLKQRALQTIKDNKTALKGIRDEIALRKSQTIDYAKEASEIMAKLQGQSFIASESYTHGTWFRKAKVNKTYGSLAGMDFEQLSSLLAQGKLEGDAKALVERLKELEQKGYDATQAMAELAKQTAELFTGTTADSLTDSLLNLFKEGKTGVADFADFFKTTMDDAALSIFKNKVLADLMSTFYDDFAKKAQSDDALSDSEITDLQNLFTSLTNQAKTKFEDLKKITGSDLTGDKSASNSSTLKGSVENITAKQADVLSANIAGQRLAQLEGNQENKQGFASLVKSGAEQLAVIREQHYVQIEIAANTLRTANNTDYLKEGLTGIKDEIQTLNKKVGSTGDAKKAMGG